jgi:hypothetical protein
VSERCQRRETGGASQRLALAYAVFCGCKRELRLQFVAQVLQVVRGGHQRVQTIPLVLGFQHLVQELPGYKKQGRTC